MTSMDRSTRIRCTTLACTLSAGACADRQRDALVSIARNAKGDGLKLKQGGSRLIACFSCEQGRGIVAEVGASAPRAQRLVTQAPRPIAVIELGAPACKRGHPVAITASGPVTCLVCAREQGDAFRARMAASRPRTRPDRVGPRYQLGGESLSLGQLSARSGIAPTTLRQRIVQLGWTIERAITEPSSTYRDAARYEFAGEKLSLHQLAKRSNGIERHTIYYRLTHGWPVERAITEPVVAVARKGAA